MSQTKPLALQMCAFSDYLQAGLDARLELVRWDLLPETERSTWLASNAGEVKVVATGGHVGCPTDLVEALPSLGIVAINGVGFDKVEIPAATDRGVEVTNTPEVLNEDVADLAIGMIIGLLRELPACDRFVREGRWQSGDMPLARKVSGSKFGILGLGRIGSQIAERLAPFGPVAYCAHEQLDSSLPFFATAPELAQWADVLVVACAATKQTQGMVNAQVLEALGERGYLVNIARGAIVDEPALAQFIAEKRIAGAALDVFVSEPNVPAELIASDRTMLAPHIASATVETRTAMADLVLANIDAYLAGSPAVTPVPR